MGFFGNKNGQDDNNRIPPNPNTRIMVGVIVSGYLMYLGYSLIKGYMQGEGGIPAWTAILFGLLFIGAGLGYIVYSLKMYRKYKDMEEAAAAEAENSEEESIEEENTEEENIEETETENIEEENP